MQESSITDWISSIASLLGVPIIIWGILKLFIKDKNQERKLSSLENLALSQDKVIKKMTDQIAELSKQTEEFRYHSELMKESNELISTQIQIQNEVFIHSKITENTKLKLQKSIRLSEIRPYFIVNRNSSNSSSIIIRLKNKEKLAKNLEFKKVEADFINFQNLESHLVEYDTNDELEIKGTIDSTNPDFNNPERQYEILLSFEDVDGNKYQQRIINGKSRSPELIDN